MALNQGGTGVNATSNANLRNQLGIDNAGNLTSGLVAQARLGVGIADATTYLRGDGAWATVSTGASALSALTDVVLTSTANNDILRYDSTASKWKNVSLGSALSGSSGTTTMVANWPDGILCGNFGGNPSSSRTYIYKGSTGTEWVYSMPGETGYWLQFNGVGSYLSRGAGSDNCTSQTITQLYAAGSAFNFIGSSLASAAAPSGGVQFNNGSGVLAGDTALVWDNTSKALGIGTATPSTKAVLDLTSTTKGFLPPRMTTVQRDAITSPAIGLQIYNTTTNALNVFNGTAWGAVGGGGALSALTDVALGVPANGHVLTYNGAQWVNAAPGTAMTTTTMEANFPDAIVCVTGAFKHYMHANHSDGSILYYEAPYSAVGGSRYWVGYSLSTGAYAGSQSNMGGSDCVTGALSVSALYASGKAFNFIGSSLASAAAPAGGVQFNNGSGALAGDTALIWDNTSKALGIGTATPSSKAVLDLTSTTKGFLPPRMTTVQRDAITSPATGLQIYNTTTGATNVYDGSAWGELGESGGTLISNVSAWTTATCPAGYQVLTCNSSAYNAGGNQVCGVSISGNGCTSGCGGGPYYVTATCYKNLSAIGGQWGTSGSDLYYNTGAVGIGTATPSTKAVLDLTSTTQGFLAPRMTTAQRDAISSPVAGLQIYNSTTNALNIHNGTTWGAVAGAGSIATDSDVTLTSVADNDILRYDNTTSRWKNVNIGTAMSTTTMVPNWPDALRCTSATLGERTLLLNSSPAWDGYYYYMEPWAAPSSFNAYIYYNSSGTYMGQGSGYDLTACNISIAATYAAGRAFNFIGSSLASAAAPAGGLQFNNGSGVLAGDAAITWDNTNKRLGVGTASPGRQLTIDGGSNDIATGKAAISITNSSTAYGPQLRLNSTGVGGREFVISSTQLSDPAGASKFQIYDNTAVAARFVLDSSGNVGIGTTAPVSRLNITDGANPYAAYAGEMLQLKRNTTNSGVSSGTAITIGNASNGFNIVYGGTSDRLGFVAGAATEVLTILNSGNVGIGTTSPAAKVHMGGANQAIRFDYDGTNNYYGSLRWAGLQLGNNGANKIIAGRTTTGGSLQFIVNNTNDASDYNVSPDGLTAMTILPSGNVGIGTNTPAGKLHVNGGVYFQGLASASSGYYLCQDSGTNQVTRGGSCSLSDFRLKRDIAPLQKALRAISTLRGVSFNWRDSGRASTDGPQIGLIAQDVEKVYPQAVVNNEDGTKGLNYDALMGPMVEAIKELKVDNDSLRKEFEAYKAAHP